MALFFSRRTYNAQKKKFTLKPAAKTRYVHITRKSPDGRIRKGGIIKRAKWLELVRQQGGTKDVLIYVHGFNTSQKDMLDRLDKIERGVRAQGYKGAVVGFDWPSDGSLHTYDQDRSDAKAVARHFVGDGILALLGMSPKPRVHIIAHSMGALVVLRGFSDFGDAAGPGNRVWSADQIVFASGDVDAQWHEKGAWADLVLKKRSKRFTNYYSGDDRVLKLSGGLVNGGRKRVGRVGMPKLTSKGHWDVQCDDQYQRDVPKGKRSSKKSHRWWFDSKGFYKDLTLTLAGRDAKTMPTRQKLPSGDQSLNA